MKNQFFYPFFTFILVFFGAASAQNITYSGKVIDKNTKEPLPFVNIFAQPSGEGSSTDFDGNFRFTPTKKIKTLTFSYLGYKSFSTETIGSNMVVELQESNIEIEEAVIVGKKNKKLPKDTAAITLYRNVTNNKPYNRPSGFDTYQYREHIKIEFDFHKIGEKFTKIKLLKPFRYMYEFIDTTENGDAFLPMLMVEKLSDIYYQNPDKMKTFVQAQYMTGVQNLSATQIVDELFVPFDLYDNIISAGGKPFPSPFSATGLLTYAYFLSDSTEENGQKFYRLDFSPKNNQTIAFSGLAWIDAESFAIKSMEFRMPLQANINFVSDFYVKQSFEKVDDGRWFMNEEIVNIAGKLNKKKKKGPSLLLRKHMTRGNITVNQPIDEKIFEGEPIILSDSINVGKSREWWVKNRVSPLNSNEEGVIIMSDSLERTKAYRNIFWLGHLGSTAYIRTGPLEWGRFYNFFSWNNVEGYRPRIGFRTNKNMHEKMQLTGYAAYGTKDEKWKFGTSMRLILPKENQKWHMVEFSYRRDFTFLGQSPDQQQFSHDNLFIALLRTSPLEKIMFIDNKRIFYENEVVRGLILGFHVDRSEFYKVDNVFEFNRMNDNNQIESFDNFAAFELGTNIHIGFKERMFKNQYYRFSAGSERPILDIKYAIGLKGFAGGDYPYHKLGLNIYHRWVNRLGFTKYTIAASKIFGESPYPLMNLPIGNQGFYFNPFAYNMMREFEFANDQSLAIWIDHHFDGKILNRIPLIKHLKFREILIAKYLLASTSQKNIDLMMLPEEMTALNGHYLEVGFGIENIFRLLRVDFLWRPTQLGKADVSKFGIRFQVSPKL